MLPLPDRRISSVLGVADTTRIAEAAAVVYSGIIDVRLRDIMGPLNAAITTIYLQSDESRSIGDAARRTGC